jgi:hypothetical protein
MPIDKGAQVRQLVPAITGEVTERRFNDEANQMEYLVLYANAEGDPAERWFLESQLTTEVAP